MRADARPEIDASRVMICGVSQGSFWATQMAAAEPRYAACAALFACFDPGNVAMLTTQSPTFRQRFMYMTGTASVEDLNARLATMTPAGLGERIHMPYLVVMGEDDPLTDPEDTYRHTATMGQASLVRYDVSTLLCGREICGPSGGIATAVRRPAWSCRFRSGAGLRCDCPARPPASCPAVLSACRNLGAGGAIVNS